MQFIIPYSEDLFIPAPNARRDPLYGLRLLPGKETKQTEIVLCHPELITGVKFKDDVETTNVALSTA